MCRVEGQEAVVQHDVWSWAAAVWEARRQEVTSSSPPTIQVAPWGFSREALLHQLLCPLLGPAPACDGHGIDCPISLLHVQCMCVHWIEPGLQGECYWSMCVHEQLQVGTTLQAEGRAKLDKWPCW